MADEIVPRPNGLSGQRISARTARTLRQVGENTLVRVATVQGEGIVQTEKVKELNRVGREAVVDTAMLRKFADTVASGDPMLADELRMLTDVARLGTAEIIADTVDTYCREGRR
jgi:hypothetical protein